MSKDLIKKIPANEPIVIADECGDSLWDAVLGQEVKACDIKDVSKSASSLLKYRLAMKQKTNCNFSLTNK